MELESRFISKYGHMNEGFTVVLSVTDVKSNLQVEK